MRFHGWVTWTALGVLLISSCGGGDDGTRPELRDPVLLLVWGFEGKGDGQFELPYGVAVDATGQVFVVDTGNARVEVFTSEGGFVRKFSVRTQPTEQPFADGILVDPAGTAYVGTTVPSAVRRYDPTGIPLGEWAVFPTPVFTVDVDRALDGSLYVGAYDGYIRKLDEQGNELVAWKALDAVDGIDVDANGNVYAVGSIDVDPDPLVTTIEDRIRKFDAAGTQLAEWGTYGTAPGEFQSLTDVAVNAAGHVYVADDATRRIIEFDAGGSFVREWGGGVPSPTQFDRPARLAFAPGGELYVTDRAGSQVFKYQVP